MMEERIMSTLLAKRLTSIREKRGITQKFVASQLGIRPNTLSGYEHGRREPDSTTLGQLADFYEVTVDFLIGRSDTPSQTKEDEETAERYGLNELPEQERMFFKDWEKYTKEEIEEAREWIEFKRQQRKKNDER